MYSNQIRQTINYFMKVNGISFKFQIVMSGYITSRTNRSQVTILAIAKPHSGCILQSKEGEVFLGKEIFYGNFEQYFNLVESYNKDVKAMLTTFVKDIIEIPNLCMPEKCSKKLLAIYG